MKILKTVNDVKDMKFWDQYIIDIFPEDPSQIEQKHFDKETKIQEAIDKIEQKKE